MFGVIVALVVVVVCGYLIINRYKPQAVLLAGGFFMMAVAIIGDYGPLVPMKQSTGFIWFDMLKYLDELISSRTAGLGMMIMVCAGFARYMDNINASKAMVKVAVKPLRKLRSPYLVLCGGYLMGQILHPFIPSASGFGLLLMVTVYPIFISLGISKNSAVAVIATNGCLDLGPTSGNSILAAKYAGITPIEYFINYQLPQAIVISIVVVTAHYFVQRWFEKKYDGGLAQGISRYEESTVKNSDEDGEKTPLFYAILPAVPLILILLFGYFKVGGIKMDINVALFLGMIVALFAEFIRTRNLKVVMDTVQTIFDGMGKQFATVITLIVAGETLAKGLTSLGVINTVINAAQGAGFGKEPMILLMSSIIFIASIVMGSGNAPFFAFSSFAPDVAKQVGSSAVNFLLPMQLSASVARSMSPITAVVVAISGVAGVSPFEVVRRTVIPLVLGMITVQIMTYLMF